MEPGSIYKSNRFGFFKVVKKITNKEVLIEFMETGFRRVCQPSNIRKGAVRDPMYPSVFGVGFIGCGDVKTQEANGKNTKAYDTWHDMIRRCYSEKYHDKKPTYRECEVCEEWQSFAEFKAWFDESYPFDGGLYHLDKDIKITGNKIYGPDTCMFVTPKENGEANNKGEVSLISPFGQKIFFKTRKEASELIGVSASLITGLLSIEGKKTKSGWSAS